MNSKNTCDCIPMKERRLNRHEGHSDHNQSNSLEEETNTSQTESSVEVEEENGNIIINKIVDDIEAASNPSNSSSDMDDEEQDMTSFVPESVPIAVRVRKVNLSYREKILGSLTNKANMTPIFVLNGISLTVPSGSIYGLLGPSGCGKTSLLRCM